MFCTMWTEHWPLLSDEYGFPNISSAGRWATSKGDGTSGWYGMAYCRNTGGTSKPSSSSSSSPRLALLCNSCYQRRISLKSSQWMGKKVILENSKWQSSGNTWFKCPKWKLHLNFTVTKWSWAAKRRQNKTLKQQTIYWRPFRFPSVFLSLHL